MSMSDRIDPGPGWRLLEVGEIVKRGDERRVLGEWFKSFNAGLPQSDSFVYRRRIAPSATKAIATRATVRVVAADGTAERSMRCDSGLSVGQMYAAIASFDGAVDALRNRTSVPKYIMFEIQRGENDC